MLQLLIATANPAKLREFRELLAGLPYTLLSLTEAGIAEEAPEAGNSLEENARAKARYYHRRSGLLTLAEDSGLEVAALGGEPGVRSARFAGEAATSRENIRLLLNRLEGVPRENRGARFRSVIAIAGAGGGVELFSGECPGLIALEPRGEGGFGYDPVFLIPELGQTFAQLTPEQKHRLSHRGQAAERARRWLENLLSRVERRANIEASQGVAHSKREGRRERRSL